MSWNKIFFERPAVLLDQYSEYVEEDRIDRLPYGQWRDLKRFFTCLNPDIDQVGFWLNEDNSLVIFQEDHSCDGGMIWDDGTYDAADGTFGTFIARFINCIDSPWKESKPIFIGKNTAQITDYNDISAKSLRDASVIERCSNDVIIEGNLIVKDKIINNNTERENNNMKFNFDFGSCENDNVKVSPYGIAVTNSAGTWVSYDTKSGNIVDVDIFNFNGGKYLFKMPVAVKDVKVGDVVIHNRVPVFVTDITDGNITVVDPRAGEKKTILPVTNMFGFNFVTRVVCLFDGAFNTPTTDNPFGNMLPFFLLSNSDNKKDGIDPLVMAMMLNGNNTAANFNNPMILAFMCADQTNMKDILPLMLLAGQGNNVFNTPAAK